MSRTFWAVAVATGLATGCNLCGGNRCSVLSRCGPEPVGALAGRDCGPPAGPMYYGDPALVGLPTSNGVRPENELPMPNQNITPPMNPLPIGIPATMPGKGK